MSEFKFTKGKWFHTFHIAKDNTHLVKRVDSNEGVSICVIRTNKEEEAKANALLISKAPEMLEMLDKVVNVRYIGASKTELENLFIEVEQLIKEATEL